MAMISRRCAKDMWLHNGECNYYGPMQKAILKYRDSLTTAPQVIKKQLDAPDAVQFISVYTSDANGKPADTFMHNDSICLSATIQIQKLLRELTFALSLYDQNRTRIFTIHKPLKRYNLKDGMLTLPDVFSKGFIVPGASWVMCLVIP